MTRSLIIAACVLATCLTGCAAPGAGSGRPSAAAPSPSSQLLGVITGQVGFPAEGIPPMVVYAISLTAPGSPFYAVETIKNQGNFTLLGIPAGTYEIYAVPASADSGSPFPAAYTKAVICGLAYGCDDHAVIPVRIVPGQTVSGIDPGDFYAPPNTFRKIPAGGPHISPVVPSPSSAYPDAASAATYEAERGTQAAGIVENIASCPRNQSCAAIGQRHDGVRAAYFVGNAGSNSDLHECAFYVFQGGSGWHPLNTACGSYPAPGRSATATFMGSGCINVRQGPGYANRILQCIPVDTRVDIDEGPVFEPEAAPSDAANLNRVWWHLVGLGWMVHQYLTWGDND
jgi:hypothetical protein